MNKAGKILSIEPPFAIPGGEISITCENLKIEDASSFFCYFNGIQARITGASGTRVLAVVPTDLDASEAEIYIENSGEKSESKKIRIGKKIAENLHMVANPAVDPKDDSLILTRSGSRGQKLPVTLLRLETDGYLDELTADVLNPTGIAFDEMGKLFITNRADGEVVQVNNGKEVVPLAGELGIATGIAFDKEGYMYVGDRSGTIFKISEMGDTEAWSVIEPSVSAYHMAFGLDENLYVTAPGLCSHDSIYQLDKSGLDQIFYKGLGRPQGLAFDEEGNLYLAACLKGRHGIIKISDGGSQAEVFVAGIGIIGLCFTRKGEMIIATRDKIYSLNAGIYGVLLD